jgi:CRP/FNR family cyclic AMP-dependent transcriptional regulator
MNHMRASARRRELHAAMAEDRLALAERALEVSPIFGVLSLTQRRRLAEAGVPVTVEAGAFLCRRGARGDGAWLVVEGQVDVRSVEADGGWVVLATLGPGTLVGEMACVDGQPRPADILATRTTRLLTLPRAVFTEALATEPGAALVLLGLLGGRLRDAERALAATQAQSLGGRLSSLLLAEADAGAVAGITPARLARRLGAPRDAVDRKLDIWSRSGAVVVSRSSVRLLKRPLLLQLAGSPPEG